MGAWFKMGSLNVTQGMVSGQGYKELYRMKLEEIDRLMEQYERDIIGFLADVYFHFGEGKPEGRAEEAARKRLHDAVNSAGLPFEKGNEILGIAEDSITEADMNGFRRGFRTSMRICMDGMKGGVAI